MEHNRRLQPSTTQLEVLDERSIEVPIYDDMSKLTTYIFVAFFYVLIVAHAPSDIGAYKNQPMPKFITTVMGCQCTTYEVTEYLASFDLIKLKLEWVKSVPMKKRSQDAVNRFGIGVAGYWLVSVFNLMQPDLYTN